jgi:hypothetical protein
MCSDKHSSNRVGHLVLRRPIRKKSYAHSSARRSTRELFGIFLQVSPNISSQMYAGPIYRIAITIFVNKLCTSGNNPIADIGEPALQAPLRSKMICRAPFQQLRQFPADRPPAVEIRVSDKNCPHFGDVRMFFLKPVECEIVQSRRINYGGTPILSS